MQRGPVTDHNSSFKMTVPHVLENFALSVLLERCGPRHGQFLAPFSQVQNVHDDRYCHFRVVRSATESLKSLS